MKTIFKISMVLLAAFAVTSCQPGGKEDAAGDETEEVKVFPVRVLEVQRDSITKTLDYTANLTAFKEIHYAPASPGRIDKVNVEVGDRIRKGQVLVELDKTQLNTAKTQLASATDSYKRIKTLYEQGSFAEQQYEQTKTQYELAQQNVKFLSENATLVSPINGIVTGKYFENGEMFSGAPNTQAGKAAVVSIMQVNPMKALVSISQTFYKDVKIGMKAQISSDILPDEVFSGKVTRVYPTINTMTRTFQTEVVIENTGEILRPGMYAKIEIALVEENVIMLPAISVLKQSGTNNRHIFVYENGKARLIQVEMGKRIDDHVEVTANENLEGKALIIEGQSRLVNGSDVRMASK